jgi:hypothetical protein
MAAKWASRTDFLLHTRKFFIFVAGTQEDFNKLELYVELLYRRSLASTVLTVKHSRGWQSGTIWGVYPGSISFEFRLKLNFS